jgi:hypothetical protein
VSATQPTGRTGQPPQIRAPQPLDLQREKLRICIYGDAGVGKTVFSGTAPRPVFVDTDGGMVSLAVQGQKPMSFSPTGYKELEGLYWWLKQNQESYDTIIWDSITTGQRLLLDEIHDQGLAGGTANKPVMQWTPEIGEYQAQQRQLARILTDLRRLGAHMILTAGVRERLGKRAPDLSPGNFTTVNHWCSIMGELVVVTHDPQGNQYPEPRRVLHTAPGGREAKSRFRSLLPGVVNPTFDGMWQKVVAEYEAATARVAAPTTSNGQKEA